jgi:two-component system, chemotaxis family, chemotaxis protein CheY
VKTVLVVDDSASLREFISFVLTDAGYSVVAAENGKEALNKLNGHNKKIDIVVTDLNMPLMNGIELAKQLHKTPVYRALPVLLVTTELHGSKKQEAQQAGVSEWINKPFSAKQIRDAIQKFLK